MNASEIIDELGGTAAVAKLCDVKLPSVSEWRRTGIPRAREQYLRLLRPDAFPQQEQPADKQPATQRPDQLRAA